MSEKTERYATIGTWERVFQAEGVNISEVTIRTRLNVAKVIGKTAKDKTGRLRRNAYYAESDVRMLCRDLFEDIPQANMDRVIELDGRTYGTIAGMPKLLGISMKAIGSRVTETTSSIQGRILSGRIETFYDVAEVRVLCQDLLQDYPEVNEEGVIDLDGEAYATAPHFSRILGINDETIRIRITEDTPFIRGKSRGGRIETYYPESEIWALCHDLLDSLSQANESGFIELDGETYGTVQAISRLLGISTHLIRNKITENTSFIKGKTVRGRVRSFYSVSDVKMLCQDLFEKIPQADDDGFIQVDGERYGTSVGLACILGISYAAILRKVDKDTPSIRGRTNRNRLHVFYPESEIRKLCADLIAKRTKKQ